MQSLGEIIGQRTGGRRGAPVRRHSRLQGREGTFWRPTSRQEAQGIVMAARRFELVNRPAGTRSGPLGHVALEVLAYLANRIDWRSGRLEPSLDTMMRTLRRSRDAIVRALDALRRHGFIDWLRRYVPAETEGLRGPQVRQTSNAYRLHLPKVAAALLGRYFAPPPPPDDDAQRRADHLAEIERQIAGLPMAERLAATVDHPGIAASLLRVHEAMKARQERESAGRTESESR